MKKLLAAMFVALLMAGCGGGDPGSDSSESNQSSAETINLDDNETRNRIIAEAIEEKKLKWMWSYAKDVWYAPNQQRPYTGWVKRMWVSNGQLSWLAQYKDGKQDGLATWWYENGQKKLEMNYKDGKRHGLWTEWYGNGEKSLEGTLSLIHIDAADE